MKIAKVIARAREQPPKTGSTTSIAQRMVSSSRTTEQVLLVKAKNLRLLRRELRAVSRRRPPARETVAVPNFGIISPSGSDRGAFPTFSRASGPARSKCRANRAGRKMRRPGEDQREITGRDSRLPNDSERPRLYAAARVDRLAGSGCLMRSVEHAAIPLPTPSDDQSTDAQKLAKGTRLYRSISPIQVH